MMIHFNELDGKKELAKKYLKILNTNKAVIFSRLDSYKECIAIIPSANYQSRKKLWIWLSGEQGSYTDGLMQDRVDIVNSLVKGEWIHQPNATITLDKNKD